MDRPLYGWNKKIWELGYTHVAHKSVLSIKFNRVVLYKLSLFAEHPRDTDVTLLGLQPCRNVTTNIAKNEQLVILY